MMEPTYQMVADQGWSFYAIAAVYLVWLVYLQRMPLIVAGLTRFGKHRDTIAGLADLCQKKVGFITAVLARYTALITINLIIFNVMLNITKYVTVDESGVFDPTSTIAIIYAICACCLLSIIAISMMIFAIGNEVMRRSSDET